MGTRNATRYSGLDNIDAAGNFDDIGFGGPSQDRDHNRQNQITVLDGLPLTYDGNGNLIGDQALALTYQYDAWNRLVAIVDARQRGPEYHYDALGRRIVEERYEPGPPVHEVRHLFYNDAWQVIHDHQLGPTPVGEAQNYASFQSYYWSAAGGDQMIGRARDLTGDDIFDERLYSLQDAQGNQSVLVDVATNLPVERAIQDPYGKYSLYRGDRSATQAPGTYKWLYFHQGLRVARESDFPDNRSQLYDNRARMYSPYWMRFIQNDPIGFAAGDPNMYRYVGNGPVSRSDPSGLGPIKVSPPQPSFDARVRAILIPEEDFKSMIAKPVMRPEDFPPSVAALRIVNDQFVSPTLPEAGSIPRFFESSLTWADRAGYVPGPVGIAGSGIGAIMSAMDGDFWGAGERALGMIPFQKLFSKGFRAFRVGIGSATARSPVWSSATGDVVINGASLPGGAGIRVGRRLTAVEMDALTHAYDVEFSLVYRTGAGRQGGGGTYWLHSGTPNQVRVPIGSDVRWISHTHPGGTAFASGIPGDQYVLWRLQQAGSPQRSSMIVPQGNAPFRFNLNSTRLP